MDNKMSLTNRIADWYIGLSDSKSVMVTIGSCLLGLIMIGLVISDVKQPETNTNPQVAIDSVTKAIQRQGKLVVMSIALNSESISSEKTWVFNAERKDTASARVDFTMKLKDFDPAWVSREGNTINVIIPKDYIKVEVQPLYNIKSSDNGSWGFTFSDSEERLREANIINLKTNLQTQGYAMMDIVRPQAAEDIQLLFQLPFRAIGENYTVVVTFA